MGNLVRYAYQADAGREPGHAWNQPLLSQIAYVDYGDPATPSFLVTVDFAYSTRPDPYSEHRAGFEVRTSLRCDAIRVSTHAADGVARVSREYRLAYDQAPFTGASLLSGVSVVGIDETGAPIGNGGPPGLAVEALPPLTFQYSAFEPAKRRFTPVTGAGLPQGALNAPGLALVDLQGVGLPDVVELGAVPRFWRNSGAGVRGRTSGRPWPGRRRAPGRRRGWPGGPARLGARVRPGAVRVLPDGLYRWVVAAILPAVPARAHG
jgi:hypothetical protein